MVDVDAADDEAAVRACSLLVEQGRDSARDRERDREAEGREHRPFAPRAQVVMQVEAGREFCGGFLVDVSGFAHARIVREVD